MRYDVSSFLTKAVCMPVEIEAKMKLVDPDAFEQLLFELKAVPLRRVFEINTFYDTSDGKLKAADRGLRTRLEQNLDDPAKRIVTITHKGPRDHGKLKSRSEAEVEVADIDAADHLLRALGYQRRISFEKLRQKWRFGNCLIEVDTVPYLGTFVEIEGPSDEVVLQVRDQLKLSDQPMIRNSYIGLLTDYVAQHKIHDDHIAFDPPVLVDAG